MRELHSYTDVVVSPLAHDVRGRDWADVPRALLADWLDVFARAVAVVEPGYRVEPLPEVVRFAVEQISSDGPYGSSENFYYLDWFSLETPSWRIAFERGRHEGNEPIGLVTRGLEHEHASYIAPQAGGPMRATFHLWHEAGLEGAVLRVLGV